MLWKFVQNCWSAHVETAAVKPSGLCAWDDDVTVFGWSSWVPAATECTHHQSTSDIGRENTRTSSAQF